jgi:hypothetical protein
MKKYFDRITEKEARENTELKCMPTEYHEVSNIAEIYAFIRLLSENKCSFLNLRNFKNEDILLQLREDGFEVRIYDYYDNHKRVSSTVISWYPNYSEKNKVEILEANFKEQQKAVNKMVMDLDKEYHNPTTPSSFDEMVAKFREDLEKDAKDFDEMMERFYMRHRIENEDKGKKFITRGINAKINKKTI